MKNCPFCAEEIQDEARVCKHCDRYVVRQSPIERLRAAWPLGVIGGLALLLGFGLGAVTMRQGRPAQGAAAPTVSLAGEVASAVRPDSLSRESAARDSALKEQARRDRFRADSIRAATPRFVRVADEDALEIGAGRYQEWKFALPATAQSCKLLGRVRGVAGGNHDVDVLLFTDDDYADWVGSQRDDRAVDPHSTWGSLRVSSVNLDYQLRGGRSFYLVVSNKFSFLTRKVVQVKARLRCMNAPLLAMR